MAYREVTRLPDAHLLIWWLLDGVTRDQFVQLSAEEQATHFVREAVTEVPTTAIDFRQQLAVSTQAMKPAPEPSVPTAQWYIHAALKSCTRYDTPSRNLSEGEVAITDQEVRWKDAGDIDEHHERVNDVTITRDGQQRVTKITRRTRT